MTVSSMRRLFVSVLLLFGFAGCSSETTTPTPTPAPTTTLTGTWSGDLALPGQSARMTWTLTQTAATVGGPVLVVLPSGTVLLNGVLTGTVSGSTLTYAINIGPGAIPSQPACTGQLAGGATSSFGVTSTLAGTYSVASSTCSTPFSSGTFTLTRM